MPIFISMSTPKNQYSYSYSWVNLVFMKRAAVSMVSFTVRRHHALSYKFAMDTVCKKPYMDNSMWNMNFQFRNCEMLSGIQSSLVTLKFMEYFSLELWNVWWISKLLGSLEIHGIFQFRIVKCLADFKAPWSHWNSWIIVQTFRHFLWIDF